VIAARVAAGVCGALLLATGLSLAGLAVATAASSEEDALATAGALSLAGELTALLGLVLLWLGQRTVALVALIVLGLAFVPVGIGLLAAAPLLRQIDNPDVDPDRAAAAVLIAGAAFLVLGLALLTLGWLWSRRDHPRRVLSRVVLWIGTGYGALLLLGGQMTAFLVFFSRPMAQDSEVTTLEMAVTLAASAFLMVVPGAALTYHGVSELMGEASGASWLPPALLPVPVFALAVAAGGLVMAMEEPVGAAMPLLHLLAAVLPGAALVGLAARGGLGWREPGCRPTWRQVFLAMGCTMVLVTMLSLLAELLLDGGILVAFLASKEAFEGAATFDDVADVLREFEVFLNNREELALALLTVAVVPPLVEEAAKGLGVRVLISPQSSKTTAFVLGVVVGASFGTVEALLYGLGGLNDADTGWWSLMLMRAGSTTSHALASGVVGLGWYYVLAAGRPLTGSLYYAMAVALHGLWNALIVLVGSRLVIPWEGLSDSDLVLVVYAVMAPVALVFLAALFIASRRLREPAPVRVLVA
jgi:RsiW-degrading membrane proteinase PrsW (M82 family)